MSLSCATGPTATLFSNRVSVSTVTDVDRQVVNGTTVRTTVVETRTVTEAVPTATLFDSVCETIVVTDAGGRQTTVPDSMATTSTGVRPMTTSAMVRASTQSGSIVFVTSYSTISATSVFVVLKTQSPSIDPAAIAAQTGASSAEPSSTSSHTGAIAGGIVGAIALLALLAGLFLLWRKRSRRDRDTRALDNFFKDAQNPGESGGTRQGTMRRKSSMILDLEKERDVSHSNDEDNWAALTRVSSMADDSGASEAYRQRSQSRSSMNALSRGVSMRSVGADGVLTGAMAAGAGGGGWITGTGADQLMVEEPEALLLRKSSDKSMASSPVSPFGGPVSPMGQYDGGPPQRLRHLSSHSADLLPSISPVPYSLPGSPELPVMRLPTGAEGPPASAPNTIGRNAYSRAQHHLSMSGIYPSPPASALPKQRSFSSSSQQMPERPKSAIDFTALSDLPGTMQWSPPTSPRMQGGRGIEARASVYGYSQHTPLTHWSPPLAPVRVTSPSHRRRSGNSPSFSGEYPPSRYSHLDVVADPEGRSAQPDDETATAPATEGAVHTRTRSLSGGALLQSAVVQSSDSAPSSSSSSKKSSLSVRNASPEHTSGGESDEPKTAAPARTTSPVHAYHERMLRSVSEKAQALLNARR